MKKVKKIVALLLSFCMMVSVIPMDTFAAGTSVVMSEDEIIDDQSMNDSPEDVVDAPADVKETAPGQTEADAPSDVSDTTVEADENTQTTIDGANDTDLAGVDANVNAAAETGESTGNIISIERNGVPTEYATVEEFYDALKDGDKVKLLTNINVQLAIEKNVELDLNGKNINSATTTTSLYINNAVVDITNGSIEHSGNDSSCYAIHIDMGSEVKIHGGVKITSNRAGFAVMGDHATLVVDGGTVAGKVRVSYLTIKDGTFTRTVSSDGVLKISGGTFSETLTIAGSCLFEITGGTFNSKVIIQSNAGEISGGKFAEAAKPSESRLADGYCFHWLSDEEYYLVAKTFATVADVKAGCDRHRFHVIEQACDARLSDDSVVTIVGEGTQSYTLSRANEKLIIDDQSSTGDVTVNPKAGYTLNVVTEGTKTTYTQTLVAPTITTTGDTNKVYDGAQVTLTANTEVEAPAYRWFKNGSEVPGATNKTLVLQDVADSGEYKVQITADGNTAESSAQTVTISKRTAAVTPDNKSKTYGAQDPVLTYSATGLVTGETLSGITVTRAEGNDVGTYALTASQVAGANPNYSVSFVSGSLFTINKAPLVVKAVDCFKTYGDTDPAFDFNVTGLVNGDTKAQISVSFRREEGNPVGTYVITPAAGNAAGNKNANYSITFQTGTLTIVKAGTAIVTEAAAKENLVYSGIPQALIEPAVAGFLTGENNRRGTIEYSLDGGVNYSTEIPTGTDAGTYTITYRVQADANHTASATKEVTASIAKKALTVTAGSYNKTYGAADPAFDFDVNGLANGDTKADISVVITRISGEAAGTYTITPAAGNAAGNKNANYNITFQNGTLTIGKASTEIVTEAAAITGLVYSGDPQVLIVPAVAGALTGDNDVLGTIEYSLDGGVNYSTGIPTGTNAGTYRITYRVKADANHTASEPKVVTATIAKKTLTVTASDAKKVHGNADPSSFAFQSVGYVKDENFNELFTASRVSGNDVGTYNIIPTYKAGYSENNIPNYDVTFVNGTFTILKAVAKINTVFYASLADAVNAAAAGNTVELLDDTTLDSRVEPTVSMNIDLGGHTVTPTRACKNRSAFDVQSGTVTIMNGTIDGSALTQTVSDGVNNECDAITVKSGANVTLKDLNITINSITGACVYAFAGANVTVESGVYKNLTNNVYPFNAKFKALTINQANVANQLVHVQGGTFYGCDPSRGDESGMVKSFMADGYATVKIIGSGKYQVVDAADVIASITEDGITTNYASLDDAIEDASAGQEVKLLKDITVNEPVYVYNAITLNLNNNTIELDDVLESVVLYIADNNVTVKNGTVTSERYYYKNEGIRYYNIGISNFYENAVIENVSVEGVGYGIYIDEGSLTVRGTTTINAVSTGVYNETQFTLGSGTDSPVINASDYGVYNEYDVYDVTPVYPVFTMKSGKVNSEDIAIDAEYGSTVTVTGGRIYAKEWGVYLNGAAFEMTGGSLESAGYGIVPFMEETTNTPSSVTISGGFVKVAEDIFANATEAVWNVTGGLYSHLPDDYMVSYIVQNGYTFELNTDETTKPVYPYKVVTLTDANAVAEIGTTKYPSLYKAMNSAQSGDTITLLKDTIVSSNIILSDGRNLTLDMNGKEIQFKDNRGFHLLSYGSNTGGTLSVTGTGRISSHENSAGTFYFEGTEIPAGSGKCEVVIGKDITVKGGINPVWFAPSNGSTGCYNASIDIYGTVSGLQPIYVNGTINGTGENAPQIRIHNTAKIVSGNLEGMNLSGYARTTVDAGATLTSVANVITIGSGELTVNGGTFTGGNEYSAILAKQHTLNLPLKVTINDGVFKAGTPITQTAGKRAEDVELLINGGKFYSTSGSTVKSEEKTGFIEGGYFNIAPVTSYVAAGKSIVVNLEGNKADYPYRVAVAVAKIGTTYYASLADAVSAASAGAEITLLTDTALDATIVTNKNLTLDLGGKTITGNGVRAFQVVDGTLTLDGTGKVTATNIENTSSVIRVGDNTTTANPALVVGENVTVTSACSYAVTIFGKNASEALTVKGTVSATGTGDNAAPAISGNGSRGNATTTITIEATGKVTSDGDFAIYHPQAGTAEILGTVIGKGGIASRAGKVIVGDGAVITANGTGQTTVGDSSVSVDFGAIVYDSDSNYPQADENSGVEILGGRIYGKLITVNDTAKIKVSNGYFSEKPEGYVIGGKDIIVNTKTEDKATYPWTIGTAVARIDTTNYASLAEAVSGAESGNEITLVRDASTPRMITLDKSVTINLNGKKINSENATMSWVQVINDAVLTINGTTEGSAAYGRIDLGKSRDINGSVVINGGTYAVGNGQTVLHINGTCLASNVTIKDANITSANDNGIQLNGKGTFSIENSTITGATGIYIKAGELTLKNSTITGTKDPVDYSYNGNGANPTGDAIVVDACSYPGGDPTLNIGEGNTITGAKKQIGYYQYSGTATIRSIVKTWTLPEGYDWVVNTNAETMGAYPYVVSKAVAAIGEEKFASLAEAFANVQNNETIRLLDNLALTADDKDGNYGNRLAINNGKTFTIDLGGYTLTGRLNLRHGNVTIKNGTVTNTTQPLNVYGSVESTATEYSVLTIASDATITAESNVVCMMNASGKKTYGAVINVAGTVKATNGENNAAIYVSGNIGNDDVEDIAAMSASNIINITGTVEGGNTMAIAMSGQATVNVMSGAKISGSTGLGVKRGVLNVSEGAVISADGAKKAPAANGNGSEDTGAAISVTSTYNKYGTIAVNVKGGKISSANNSAVYVEHSGSTKVPFVKGYTIAIRGGEFTSANGVPTVFVADSISGDFAGYTKAIIPADSTAKFTSDASDYCVNGYKTKLVNGWYSVVSAGVEPVVVDTTQIETTDENILSIIGKINANSAMTEAGASNIQDKFDETAQLQIVLENVEAMSAAVAGKLVYNVKPVRVITDPVTGDETITELEQINVGVKFRLAVVTDSSFVYVSHTPDGQDTPDWTKKFNVSGTGDQKYIELTASEFNKFTIQDPAVYSPAAYITANGETTYYATLASAVEAALDGQTIHVASANNEVITVNKAIAITGAVCSGLSAGEHYKVVVNDTTYTFIANTYLVSVKNEDDATIGNLTGGGYYTYGKEATVTATEQVGYKFAGWYVEGVQVSADNTYQFTVTEDITLVAKYIASADVKLSLTVNASRFTITGKTTTQKGYQNYRIAAGTSVTVTYTDANYKFLYWANENNKVVSKNPAYTFILGANTALHAVYAEKEAGEDALIVFLSAYDQILLAQTCTVEDEIEFPEIIPYKLGYEFEKWVIEDTDTEATAESIKAAIAENSVIKVVPSYKSNVNTYDITVKYSLNGQKVEMSRETLPIGAAKNLAADATYQDAVFMYWTDADGNILSYSPKLVVKSTTDVEVIAVYGNSVEAKATVRITEVTNGVQGNYYTVSFSETYAIPEGCTLNKTGFVRALDASAATEANMNLEGTNLKIYTSSLTGPQGIYTQHLGSLNSANVYYMRAYVQYTDQNGAVQTVYSDIVSASWNELQGQQ